MAQKVILDARKSMFWVENRTLILSDLHLGKAGHFRKNGIPIPTEVHQSDLQIISSLIVEYEPLTVIFLGDLFHSEYNKEWGSFSTWLGQYLNIDMVLVRGNHDVLEEQDYIKTSLRHCFRSYLASISFYP